MRETTPQSRLRPRPVTPPAGIYMEPPRGAKPARARGESMFSDHLPGYIVEPAGFHMIAVAAPTIATGQQAWYGLRRIRFEQDQVESQLIGYRMSMLPPDTAASTVSGVTGVAWGDRRGISAAIVIGQNLPITPGGWSSAAAHIPGIDAANAAATAHTSLLSPTGAVPKYIAVESFPTGSYADTTPNKSTPARTFAPFVYTFRTGMTLDVALVVGSIHISGITGTIIGMVDVRLMLSPIDGALTGRGTQ